MIFTARSLTFLKSSGFSLKWSNASLLSLSYNFWFRYRNRAPISFSSILRWSFVLCSDLKMESEFGGVGARTGDGEEAEGAFRGFSEGKDFECLFVEEFFWTFRSSLDAKLFCCFGNFFLCSGGFRLLFSFSSTFGSPNFRPGTSKSIFNYRGSITAEELKLRKG